MTADTEHADPKSPVGARPPSVMLQQPDYVFEQYQRWFVSRAADNRRMNMDIAPRDFAMLSKVAHVNLSGYGLVAQQVLAAAAAAAIWTFGRSAS
jgi:hypothetical protein